MDFKINNNKVFSLDTGEAFDKSKKSIILLHGSGQSHVVWSLTAEYLSGYDYNVLLSAMNEIKKNKPSLFFEYMSLNKAEYIELIKKLYEIGYLKWTIINNYGSVIFENRHYKDVLDYINLEKNSEIIIDIYCETNLGMNNQ